MLTENKIIHDLKERLNKERFKHTLAVADTAEEIAKKVDVSVDRARKAGLLHDYAKNLSKEEIMTLAYLARKEEPGLKIDDMEINLSPVLHAPVGAYLVKRDYGLAEEDILEAIRYHTIGSPDMGKLAQIIFVADFIEPNRDFPCIDKVRESLKTDLHDIIILICNHTIKYNIEQGRLIHPNTLFMRNRYLGGIT